MILAKTVKGWTLGPDVEGRNATHQIKKMNRRAAQGRSGDRLHLHDEIPDEAFDGDEPPYYRPAADSPEIRYMLDRRQALDGACRCAATVRAAPAAPCPSRRAVRRVRCRAPASQAVSTTMAFTRLLRNLCRDPKFGPRVVPIIPDEARTFGMDSLFREFEIYASQGQLYEPVDHALLLSYTEGQDGQILEEGITEAGGLASFTAAGTQLRHPRRRRWCRSSSSIRCSASSGSATSSGPRPTPGPGASCSAPPPGATTLLGEGLQHQDGHSLVLASTVPDVRGLRPGLRLRAGRHRPGRHPPDVRRTGGTSPTARTSSTT